MAAPSTIDALLAARAGTHPDRTFLRFAEGDLTFAEVDRLVDERSALIARGVRRGAVVPVMATNDAETVVTWFALNRAGAVAAMLNPSMRSHSLDDVISPDAALVLFTSGTTGRSKGCVLSHRYAMGQAQLMIEHLELRTDDVLYSPFPLFHIDAVVLTVMPALLLGTTAAVGRRFSVSGFWDEVRRFGATVFDYMGATLTMLHRRPPNARDADNRVRLAWGVPVPEFAPEFEERFGLRIVTLYGSTDAGVPMYQPLHEPMPVGSCGRLVEPYEARLVDGELHLRCAEPGLMSDGYLGIGPHGEWLRTGDLLRCDEDGWWYFLGRATDSIRRRGENISAYEVEQVVRRHPDVLDVAAYGVPSDLTEDDVMVAVVARVGRMVDPADVTALCAAHLPRHMVPRYVDIVDALPRTPTEKVEKATLRTRGITATTWDREA